MTHSSELRRLIRVVEDAATIQPSQQLERYIQRYPDSVSDDLQTLLANIERHAKETRSRYSWAIAQLPDERFIELFPRTAEQFGLPILRQGSSEEFF